MRHSASWGALASLLILGLQSSPTRADFLNGGFESGNFSGWTQNGGQFNGGTSYSYNGTFRNAIQTVGNDPIVGAALQRVFNGNFSARVEDIANGARFSEIKQAVAWTDSDIFFAFAAVFQDPNHLSSENPHLRVTLTNTTKSKVLYSNFYESNNVGTAVQFNSSIVYIPWQTVQLNLSNLSSSDFQSGDTLELKMIGSDCSLTGHGGYVYLDGFGAQAPQGVPAPPAILLVALGLPIFGLKRFRRSIGL